MIHLGRTTAALFASPTYLQRHGNPQTPEEIADHVLLDNAKNPVKVWTLYRGSDQVRVGVSPRIVCNDTVILLEHAIAHLGIAVLPKFITLPAIEQHQLRPVLADWLINQVDINALYPSYKGISPAVRAFTHLAQQRFKQVLIDP